MKKMVILGSHSFSGSTFLANIPRDEMEILCISRNENYSSRPQSDVSNGGIKHHQTNNNSDPKGIGILIRDFSPNYIVNFAAQSMVGQSWQSPQDWYETNISSFAEMLLPIQGIKTLEKFVQFTTPEVYGTTNGWVKENFNFSPNTPYAVSRAAADWHLKALHENFGFPVIFTRAANVYGEYQPLYRIVPKAIFAAITGEKLPLQGGGESIRSFIHMDDVSKALNSILKNGKIGESYHISTNELVSIKELVEKIAEKLSRELSEFVELAPDRPGKDFAYQLDSSKIRLELGWSDEISLSQGLDRTIEWIRNNLKDLAAAPREYIHKR